MNREEMQAMVTSLFEFRHKHPVISIFLSVLVTAACAGALYLMFANFPSFVPCFSGGCEG